MLEVKYGNKQEKEWVLGSILKDLYEDDGTLFILILDDRDTYKDGTKCYNTIVLHDMDKHDKFDFELNHIVPVSLDSIKSQYKLVATPDEYKMTLELP